MTVDAEVAASTFKSATGQHYVEEERIVNKADGYEVVTVKRQLPPDSNSQRFWLKNRQPKLWKDRVEVKEEAVIRVIPWDELREISKKALEFADTEHERLIVGRAERLGIKLEYGETKDWNRPHDWFNRGKYQMTDRKRGGKRLGSGRKKVL